MSRQEGEKQITRLIEKYENLTLAQRKQYNEANTRKNFILPLFEILGWDTRSEDVPEEERASGKRVDYAFKINGITKFFLEAKPLSADLDELRWAEQAIWYAYHKSVPWVVLTDFESIKVFNAEWDEQDAERSLVFEISYKDYLTSDKLWFLSRLSIEKGELDEYAEKEFKKPKRVAVDKQLVVDLLRWRDNLYNDFSGYNPLIDKKKIAENVQKVLNRIIFIRTCEDRGFEEKSLQEMVRNYEEGRSKSDDLVNSLRILFREFDKNYDSKLFEEKILFESEKFIVDDNILAGVIKETYKGSKGIRWNFNDINGDVLGGIYEQYLGQIQREDGKEKKSSKRKSQGIYYTPRYIVDYIVENTLGEILKNKPAHEASKIKILDPACGSGSFLIKAFEVLDNHIRRKLNQKGDNWLINYARKFNILTSNIYGVDLDPEAVEIAQLNLLIKALEKRERLPNLSHNIECGNSLIFGTETELKKYFGKNWKDKKPFNWQEKFSEVFKQGGFDVIIGNPPYGAELSKVEQNYFKEIYEIGSTDTAILFIKKSLENLEEGGFLGFIIPKAFCFASNWQKIRDLVWDNVLTIIDCGKVWREVKLEQVVVILQKGLKHKKYQSGIIQNEQIKIIGQIGKFDIEQFGLFLNGISDRELMIAQKVLKSSIKLNDIAKNKRGAMLQKEISNNGDTEVIGGAHLCRAGVVGIKGKINRGSIIDEKAFIKSNSVLVQRIIAHIENPTEHIKIVAVVPNNKNQIIVDTINQITTTDKNYSPQFICTLLNSQFINWYVYRFILGKAIRSMEFDNPTTSRLPIPKIDFSNKQEKVRHDELVKLANKMSKLNKEFQKLDSFLNEEKYNEIKKEIQKTDKEIDEKVYKLYGLTPEEIKIVKGSR